MNNLISFLERNRALALIINCIYFLLVVLPHEAVGKFVESTLDKPLGRSNYNLLIISVAALSVIALLTFIRRRAKMLDDDVRPKLLMLFVFNLLCIAVSVFTIMVINIELIHVLQYALLSILMFPILRNYRETLFWVTIAGALDELYQYLVLSPLKNDYYDFNDVIINMLGAALGLILLRYYKVSEIKRSWIKSPASWTMILGMTVLMIGSLAGVIAIYPADGPVIFEFIKEYEAGFWHELPKSKTFHIVRPFEAIVIISILFNIFKHTSLNKR